MPNFYALRCAKSDVYEIDLRSVATSLFQVLTFHFVSLLSTDLLLFVLQMTKLFGLVHWPKKKENANCRPQSNSFCSKCEFNLITLLLFKTSYTIENCINSFFWPYEFALLINLVVFTTDTNERENPHKILQMS